MQTTISSSGIDPEPAVAAWELWTVANMLISAHGDDAEVHAQAKLAEARHSRDEGGEIVWQGVVTQLQRLRSNAGA